MILDGFASDRGKVEPFSLRPWNQSNPESVGPFLMQDSDASARYGLHGGVDANHVTVSRRRRMQVARLGDAVGLASRHSHALGVTRFGVV